MKAMQIDPWGSSLRMLEQVSHPKLAQLAQFAAQRHRRRRPGGFHQAQRHRGGVDGPGTAGGQRVTRRLERAQLHRAGRLDL